MTPADHPASTWPRDNGRQVRSVAFLVESLRAASQRRAATTDDAAWIHEDEPHPDPGLAEALAAQYQPRPAQGHGRANTASSAPQWSQGHDPEEVPAADAVDQPSRQLTSHGQHGQEQTVAEVLPWQAVRLQDGLPPGCFPADREQLLEAAVHRHARPAIIQILSELPTGRTFADLTALLDTIDTPR